MTKLSKQELHNLAMNIVGKKLEDRGFEFIAINSKIYKHPQVVCVAKKNIRHFVLVKAVSYPEDPEVYDEIWMQTFVNHAEKHRAKVWYAGVGLANAKDFSKPLEKDTNFVVNFKEFLKIN
jgi:hypothetical protein